MTSRLIQANPALEAPASAAETPSRAAVNGYERARDRTRFWRDALLRRMLGIADLASATVISALMLSSPSLFLWPFVFLPAWVLLAKLLGLYDGDHRRMRHSTLDEVPRIFAWAAVSTAGLVLLLPLTPAGSVDSGTAFLACLVGGVTSVALRGFMRSLWRRITPPESTLLIGGDDVARAIQRKIDLFHDLHIRLDEQVPLPADFGATGDLGALLSRVDRVIVATDALRADWVEDLAVCCRTLHIKMSVISPLRGRAAAAPRVSKLADLSVLEYNTWDVSRSSMVMKRVFDVAVAGVSLVLCSPLMAAIACAVKLGSAGPLLFVQRRAGVDGKPFLMLKFRTMVADAEANLAELVVLDELAEPCFKLVGDPRVTRVGRFLRRFSLDELPQLVNVIKGDMSIVGPRPEQLDLVARYRPEHRFRLAVKPGMTGPMQVNGRGALSFPERLAVELEYVENLSLGQDLKILAGTFAAVSRGTGAY